MGVALRARTIQAAPLMQVVVFLSVFMSVAYAPREALTGWLRHVSNLNPVTYLMEASRAAELSYLGWDELWKGIAAVAILVGLLGAWALSGLGGLAPALGDAPGAPLVGAQREPADDVDDEDGRRDLQRTEGQRDHLDGEEGEGAGDQDDPHAAPAGVVGRWLHGASVVRVTAVHRFPGGPPLHCARCAPL